eukprot:609276-Amphidinium_carterae.1
MKIVAACILGCPTPRHTAQAGTTHDNTSIEWFWVYHSGHNAVLLSAVDKVLRKTKLFTVLTMEVSWKVVVLCALHMQALDGCSAMLAAKQQGHVERSTLCASAPLTLAFSGGCP